MTESVAELKRARAAIKRERTKLLNEMKKLVAKQDDEEGGGFSDDDRSRFDQHEKDIAEHDARIKEHDGRIELLETLQALEAAEAEEVEDPADDVEMMAHTSINKNNVVIRHRRPKHEVKGTRFARFVMGAGLAKQWGSVNAGARYIQDNFSDDEVAKALNTTTQAAGGALIPQDFRSELIELLYAQTVVRGGGATVYPMPNGNLTIPRLRAGMTAQWQGELDDIGISQPATDDIQMQAHKLTGLVPVSNDLIRRSPISVEAIVRDDMVRQIALAEDLAFLTSDGTSSRPTGLLSFAGHTNTNTTSVTLSVVNNELQLAELNLRSANVPMDGVRWIFNPALRSFLSTLTDSVGRFFFKEELDRGTLNGFPYMMTNQLPTNISSTRQYMFLVSMPNVIIGDTLNMFADSSAEATYVSGGSTVSAYQRDQTLFRVIEEVDLAVRHAQAIHVSTVASWVPSSFTPAAGAAYSTQSANTDASVAGSANPV